jgi:hypothetical protein
MEISVALLADYANVTADGKLNILGVFDTIFADRFPVTHGQMQLVLRFEAHPAEAGAQKKLDIRLMSDDGRNVLSLSAEMAFQVKDASKPIGEMLKSDQIIGLQNVVFEKPGDYQFAILVNGETKKTVPLKVRQRPPRPPA